MIVTAAAVGLSSGNRLLSSSSYYSDHGNDHGLTLCQNALSKCVITAKMSENYGPRSQSSNPSTQSVKALKEHAETVSGSAPWTEETWFRTLSHDLEEESSELDYSVEALLLLQKSMLENHWNLSFDRTVSNDSLRTKFQEKIPVTCSGLSARQRRMNAKKRRLSHSKVMLQTSLSEQLNSDIDRDLLQNRFKDYVKGFSSKELLTHAQVVRLSKIIKAGLSLEEHKSRLRDRLGYDPSDAQLAASLSITRAELQSKLIECSLARERLAMSNVRLVLSVAQRYNSIDAQMADLVQGGLIGLMRGIEKFDSSKGFKFSTYVYWWIRQGVFRALVENSSILRLPYYLHERLGLIRDAKIRLQGRGVIPSIDTIAECLSMSKRKVQNATKAVGQVNSLDSEAFPSLNGLRGETHHSYIADNCPENNPWNGVHEWALKEEVNSLINSTLKERERYIIRLYYGLDKESLSWEDISKRMGLSRERVRQVGLVAMEKLKHTARRRNMEAMLVKH